MLRLVYKGSLTLTLVGLGLEVNPGDEISVSAELGESLLRRSDFRRATEHNLAEPADVDKESTPEPAPKPKQKTTETKAS